MTGEQKSSRRCVSSPGLPAPGLPDKMILENIRVTKKKKGVQLPELDIEPAESLWEG